MCLVIHMRSIIHSKSFLKFITTIEPNEDDVKAGIVMVPTNILGINNLTPYGGCM